MFKKRRKLLSQNFLKDRKLLTKLLRQTSIGKKDIVLDIGAGEGIITRVLAKSADKILAIEVDKKLADSLREQFKFQKNVAVINKDFRNFCLPKDNYKVLANIPFIITSVVIKKLLFAKDPPLDAYLVVQKEAAEKFMTRFDKRNSQISVLVHPFFDIKVIHRFKRSDFYPRPKVDSVLLHIEKRSEYLINIKHRSLFQDFVVFAFNQTKPNIIEGLSSVFGKSEIISLSKKIGISPRSKPSELDPKHWIELFEYFVENVKNNKVKGSFKKLLKQQIRLQKIHRTRNNSTWKDKVRH